jgi:hypothetical protein
MQSSFGKVMMEKLQSKPGFVYGNVLEVEAAGHMVAWDNPRSFVRTLLTECVDVKSLILS